MMGFLQLSFKDLTQGHKFLLVVDDVPSPAPPILEFSLQNAPCEELAAGFSLNVSFPYER